VYTVGCLGRRRLDVQEIQKFSRRNPQVRLYDIVSGNRDVFEDNMVEAKAKAKARGLRGQGEGHKILSSRSRPVLEDPIPGRFLPCNAMQRVVMPSGLSVHHSQRPTAASCALVYEVLYLWY